MVNGNSRGRTRERKKLNREAAIMEFVSNDVVVERKGGEMKTRVKPITGRESFSSNDVSSSSSLDSFSSIPGIFFAQQVSEKKKKKKKAIPNLPRN